MWQSSSDAPLGDVVGAGPGGFSLSSVRAGANCQRIQDRARLQRATPRAGRNQGLQGATDLLKLLYLPPDLVELCRCLLLDIRAVGRPEPVLRSRASIR